MAVIELSDVYFRYQGSDEYALRGVTLSADRGEFIVLVGPSGCGKSTLLRVLNGLIPHFYEGEFRGEARVAGLDVKRTPTHILARHVGIVFQDPENQLFLSSVEREIAFGLENMGLPRSEIKRRVEEALRLFGLEGLRDKAPYELSGGQQQKVAIASVMVLEPEVLAMDEPTANLDPLSALEILSLVRRLVDERKVVAIVVEHRMELALKFATRLIAMDRGEIMVDDEPHAAVDKVLGLVGVPPVVLAHELLKKRGLVQGYPPLTPEDLSKEVVEVIRRWRR
ncbi:MAG: ABC transporter ATP-binding protein [Thermofilaceae archaeon]